MKAQVLVPNDRSNIHDTMHRLLSQQGERNERLCAMHDTGQRGRITVGGES